MSSKALIAALACVIPCIAGAQQNSSSPPSGVQAQGNASVQGSASAQKNASEPGGASVQSDSASANAVLSGTVDAKKAKPGDPVTAKTTEPTTTADHTQLPKGTKLLGRVTEAKAAGKGEAQSTLGIVFDRAVLKDGREIPINTTVRALAAAEGAAGASSGDAMGSVGGAGRAMGGGDIGGGRVGGGALGGASGAVGGVGGTAGGAVSGVAGGSGRIANGAGNVAGGAAGTLGSTASASGRTLAGSAGAVGGLNSQGMLSAGSQGVFGMKDVTLAQSASGGGSVVTSAGRNVRLESGTRMLLTVEGAATHSAAASQ